MWDEEEGAYVSECAPYPDARPLARWRVRRLMRKIRHVSPRELWRWMHPEEKDDG